MLPAWIKYTCAFGTCVSQETTFAFSPDDIRSGSTTISQAHEGVEQEGTQSVASSDSGARATFSVSMPAHRPWPTPGFLFKSRRVDVLKKKGRKKKRCTDLCMKTLKQKGKTIAKGRTTEA